MTTPDKLRLAIIGCGKAGSQHFAAASATGRFEIVSCYDSVSDRSLPDVTRAKELEAALRGSDPDAVAVCTPPGTHLQIALDSLAAGCSVMLEKPPLMSLAEYRRLHDVTKRTNRPVHVMLQHRLAHPPPVDEGGLKLGTLLVSRPRPDRWFTQGWHADPTLAYGGILSHLAIHYLDLAVERMGDPVAFYPSPGSDSRGGIDRLVAGTLSFANGSQLALAVTGFDVARTETLIIASAKGIFGIRDGLTIDAAPDSLRLSPARLREMAYEDFADAVARQPARHGNGGFRLDLEGMDKLRKALDVIHVHLKGEVGI